MKYKDSESKLKHARKLFEDLVDHYEVSHAEAHRASRFYHNTDCEGQWEKEDLDYLRRNERLALTFNVLRPKIDTFLGMYADAQRVPVVSATGSDTLAAEVIDAVKEQVLKEANYASLAARQLKAGTVEGECSIHIEVLPSDDGPEWVKVVLHRVLSVESLWDKASVEPDRSDARHLFWYRWLDEDEFASEYPDHAEEFGALRGASKDGDDDSKMFGERGDNSPNLYDYSSDANDRYYYDKRENKVRVIRYEYKHLEKVKYATNLESGEKIKLEDEKIKRRVDTAIALGHPMQIVEITEEPTRVCEFIGSTLLAEYDEAGPFKGFSLVPYAFEVDEETGTPYGLARNMFDPQMELNKARSLDLELTAQATTPGTIAEIDAIPDRKSYEMERRRPNGIALVAKGALSDGSPKVIERQATPPSALAAQRSQAAMELMTEVSGIPSNSSMVPAEQAQAGITVAIRYHKSRQTVSTPFSHFEQAQKNLVQKVTEIIVNVMPDDQITALLGPREDLKVIDGRIVEMEAAPQPPQMGPVPGLEGPGPMPSGMPGMQVPAGPGMPGMPMPGMQGPQQPPMVPKRIADLNSIRDIKWHLDMEYTSENSTLRMLELDILLQLAGVGIPVDPEVLIERATNSRSVRERLKKFLDKAQQAQAEGSKAEADALRAQGEGMIKIEAAKVEETARHNKETERLDAIEIMMKTELEKMKVYADADDTEKGHMLDVVKMAAQVKMNREKVNSGGTNGSK